MDPTISQLLLQWNDGDETALERLMPLIYDELRRLARSSLRRERADHTLQPTALVNLAGPAGAVKMQEQRVRGSRLEGRRLRDVHDVVA